LTETSALAVTKGVKWRQPRNASPQIKIFATYCHFKTDYELERGEKDCSMCYERILKFFWALRSYMKKILTFLAYFLIK